MHDLKYYTRYKYESLNTLACHQESTNGSTKFSVKISLVQ